MPILFIMALICWRGRGGGGHFLFIQNFFFDDVHLQIIASTSPKAFVENSLAQSAILLTIIPSSFYANHTI